MSDLPSHGDLSPAPPSPVDPASGDPTAVMGRRILAWLIDLVLFLAVAIGTFAALAERVEVPESFSLDPCEALQEQAPDQASGCVDLGDEVFITSDSDSLLQAAASIGYLAVFVVLQGVTGASPGKLVTGIRVVDARGGIAGVGRSVVRTVLWAVDGAPWIVPLVGFITGVTSAGHRRVGDLAASTWVVSRSAVGSPPALATPSFDPTTPGTWTPPAAPPTSWPAPEGSPPTAADPDPEEVHAIVSGAEPDTAPTSEPAPDEPWEWQPPTTPGDDFGTVAADASPTAGPTPFVAPGSEAPPPTEPSELPPPQWDQARGTYIQWDPRQRAWLQWDTVGQRWQPIDT